MMAEEVADLKGHNNVSESKAENNNSVVRNIRDNVEQEERPSSLNSRCQSVITKHRRDSTVSTTSDSDVESSVAHSSRRRNSVKREKRYLPPDEPNEVNEEISLEQFLSESDSSPALLRNILLTVAVTEAEREKKLSQDSKTPESLRMDDLSSPSNSVQSEKEEHTSPIRNKFTRSRPEKEINNDDKSTKSESHLLDGSTQRINTYIKRTKSAPVEVATRCTQTEWSWIEDMRKFESLRSQQQTDNMGQSKDQKDTPEGCTKETDLNQTEVTEDELFREPIMEVSSESSSDEEDLIMELDKESFLPSIGPPKILQYIKESVNPPFTNELPGEDRQDVSDKDGLDDHSCEFCKTEVVGSDEVSQAMISPEKGEPTNCPVYEEHMKQKSTHKEDEDFIKDELIDIRPHPPFGTKAARKAAKERAAERAREREIERQKVSGNAVNFYAMTRQMKTLAYSLASTKCMDEGWTVRPLSPMGTENEESLQPFDIKINSSMAQQREMFFERFYTDGKRLLVVFPDGTGCCYYPSGNPAIIISSTEKGKYSYVLQEDTYEHSRDRSGILGVFDPTGHGCCYFQQTGKLRMVLTPFGGTYFDNKGEKKKKWLWYNNHDNHVHAPPFQPVTFAVTKELSVRCMGQDYIIVTYNYGRHTIRFNVGARLKAAGKIKPRSSEEDYELQLKEIRKFVSLVIERVQMTLRFPRSTRINKLPLPKPERRSKDRKILDTDDNVTVVVN